MRGSPAVIVIGASLLLSGCVAQPPSSPVFAPPSTAYGEVTFIDDVDFGAADGIRLDVCLPEKTPTTARPAIISIHGGGWTKGDKSQRPWRDTCAWLASEGFVVFQTNYRLAPAHPFPAAINDAARAVDWIRADAQVARFGHDPARLGAFGDSAGGNLVSLLGTRGDATAGSAGRIAAVVELSAPLDLTEAGIALGGLDAGFQRVQLDYLGCVSYADCPIATSASPLLQIDASDPPFFIAHSTDEFIPVEQAEAFVSALENASVEVTFAPVAGTKHALALLDDDLRATIIEWLHAHLDE